MVNEMHKLSRPQGSLVCSIFPFACFSYNSDVSVVYMCAVSFCFALPEIFGWGVGVQASRIDGAWGRA